MIGQAWLMRQRARRRIGHLARQDAAAVQTAVLLGLVSEGEGDGVRGGRTGSRRCVRWRDYQAQVPVLRYEDFWARWWRQNFPLRTERDVAGAGAVPRQERGGSLTGTPRTVPGQPRACRGRLGGGLADALAFHLAACPGSRLAGGEILSLGGSVELRRMGPGGAHGRSGRDCGGDHAGGGCGSGPGRRGMWRCCSTGRRSWTGWRGGALKRDIRGVTGAPGSLLALFERLSALHPGSSAYAGADFS